MRLALGRPWTFFHTQTLHDKTCCQNSRRLRIFVSFGTSLNMRITARRPFSPFPPFQCCTPVLARHRQIDTRSNNIEKGGRGDVKGCVEMEANYVLVLTSNIASFDNSFVVQCGFGWNSLECCWSSVTSTGKICSLPCGSFACEPGTRVRLAKRTFLLIYRDPSKTR